ncbi:MAG: valine--tRNA ligase [Desulfobacterota bacterium]|nr:valine--tRNA ligase [Thermodesulfobacteriota bacterium]MDW8001984.1 valine--tRNA ligase [Deltaproteobacteria bacterium]
MLEKVYNPKNVEEKWYKFWLDKGYFTAKTDSELKPFSIVIPPPNVTGSLHMGHALNNTLQDIVVRYKRMAGFNTLWLPGTDHAGIATQNVVERELAKENLKREDLGRDGFLKRVWEWKEKYGRTIMEQLMKLGCSLDWTRERFTMDEGLSRAVREVFVRLYEEGLIYRGYYIINWCPRCKTALSDLEVEHEEEKGFLYYVRYPLERGAEFLVVATTRPETMLGDTAVAVNPEDARYKKYVGSFAVLPIAERKIPIIADPHVDPNFGTGVLKVTPAHDFYDFEIGKKHNLPQIKVIDEDGRMNENAFLFAGLDRFECRRLLLEELKKRNLFEKQEPYSLVLGKCYRCKTVVEPSLSLQWFVKMKPLAEPAIEVVRSKRVRIIPEMWEKVYFDWMNNIKDWCISRQIWWGHRLPVWYCKMCEKTYVSREDLELCESCGQRLIQDEDVLDTWFSSALWPFSTLGWPKKTKDLEIFYPTSLLVTGFDILFFWVARMIMMGLKFMGDVPFREVYIHALVRDAEGKKMSKSRGNVIDPLIMIEKYGCDAFRFTLAMLTSQGRDILLSTERIEGSRNFVNKIWNAARLSLPFLEGMDFFEEGSFRNDSTFLPDRWIVTRLVKVIKRVTDALESYHFNEASIALYDFIWHEFCDWYLELIKPNLYGRVSVFDSKKTRLTLFFTFRSILKLLHPFMPFITEEIYQMLPHKEKESIMIDSYPKADESLMDEEAERKMSVIIETIDAIRRIRGEVNIQPNVKIDAHIKAKDKEELLKLYVPYVMELAKLRNVFFVEEEIQEKCAIEVVDDVEIYIPLTDIIDVDKEISRIEKEMKRLDEELEKVFKKLNNKDFLEKAPPEVIEKNKETLEELRNKRSKLAIGRKRLEAIR